MVELLPTDPGPRFILRGDAGGVAMLGLAIPDAPCRAARAGDFAALWLGPDEWLLLGAAHDALAAPLSGVAHALVEVSHRQLGYRLAGPEAETLLAGAIPLDLSAFPVGMCARTICEKAEIVLWRTGDTEWHIEIARSHAPYLRDLLRAIARADGL